MTEVSRLSVAVVADTSDLKKGMADADQAVKGFGSSMGSILGGIGMGIGSKVFDTIVSGFGAAKSAAIDLNSMLQQSKIAFTTMLGSEKAADDFLKQMADFAAKTPFEFPDLVTASKRMFAFGFAAKDIMPLMTAVGDSVAAVGGGAEVINGVTLALGQMKAKGKVSAEEMGQLAERGIPAWEMLAKAMGKSTAEVMGLVSKGLVPAQVMIDAFIKGSAERFGGMMEKQSVSFEGAMSTIKDSLNMAVANGFKPMFDFITEGLVKLAGFVGSDMFASWGVAMSSAMTQLVAAMRQGLVQAEQLWTNWIRPIIQTVTGWFTILQSQGLSPFLASIGTWILGVVPQLGQMFASWATATVSWLETAVPELGAGFMTLVGNFIQWVNTAGPQISIAFQMWGTALWTWLTTAGPQLIQRLVAVGGELMAWVANTSGLWVRALLEWATAFVTWVTPVIPQLLSSLGQLVAGVVTWITSNGPTILSALANWALTFWAWVGPAVGPLISALGTLLSTLGSWIVSTAAPAILMQLGTWGAAFTQWVVNTAAPGAMGALGTLLQQIVSWITGPGAQALTSATQSWAAAFVDWAVPAGEQLAQQLASDSSSMWAQIIQIYTDARRTISTTIAEANRTDAATHRAFLEQMRSDAQSILAQYISIQQGVWRQAQTLFQQAFSAIKQIHTAFLNDLLNEFPQRMGQYLGFQQQIWGQVSSAIERVLQNISNIHRNFWNGMVEAARSAAGNIASQVANMVNSIQRVIDKIRSVPSMPGASSRGSYYVYGKGGVIDEPVVGYGMRTGSQYLLGESGPEAVVPLTGSNSMSAATALSGSAPMGGGVSSPTVVNNIVVNIHGHALADKRSIADAVIEGLQAAQQQNRTRVRVV